MKLGDLRRLDLPNDTELGVDLGDGTLVRLNRIVVLPPVLDHSSLVVLHAGQEITLDADYHLREL